MTHHHIHHHTTHSHQHVTHHHHAPHHHSAHHLHVHKHPPKTEVHLGTVTGEPGQGNPSTHTSEQRG